MKKLNESYFTAAVYAFGVAAFSLLFLTFCINFAVITSAIGGFFTAITSLLYAVLFAFLLFPAVKRFDSLFDRVLCKKRQRPMLVSGLSITTSLILALGLVTLILVFIIPRLITDATALYDFVLRAKDALDEFILENAVDQPFWLEIYEALTQFLFGSAGGTTAFMQDLIGSLSHVLSLIVDQIASIFMGLIIAVYFLATRRVISGIIGKLVVAVIPEKHTTRFVLFFKRIYTDFSTFTFNRFLIACFFATVVAVICVLMGVPLLSVIVLLVLLSHLIPVIGPIIGDSAAIVFVVILKGTWWGLFFALLIILLEIFSTNVILVNALPKKLRPPYGVTAVVVLLSLALFNVIGAFVAVPIYASLNMEVRRLLIHRLAKRGLPVSSDAYLSFNSDEYEKLAKEQSAAAEVTENTSDGDKTQEN